MKNLLLITLIFYSLLGNLNNLKAQMVYMPDSMLRLKLTNLGFGTCIVGDSIDSSCPQILSALNLDISSSSIRNLQGIQVFPNLIRLKCNRNNGLSIPLLPNSLKEFYCEEDSLIMLPTLPVNLTVLSVNSNKLTLLPSMPDSLEELHCWQNPILSLPALPNLLEVLNCGYTSISELPTLPSGLRTLECTNDSINVLPALPDSLRDLWCSGTNLSSIPSLPQKLEYLTCANNLLTELPPLPNSLEGLDCTSNLLTTIPTLISTKLHWFLCSDNRITSLPVFPNSLYNLECHSNLLTSIPDLPDSLYSLDCSNNVSLHCLPELKFIYDLNFSNCPIVCLPNYGNVVTSNPPLNSLPLCDIFNSNACDISWNISGKTFNDSDFDCNQSLNENGLRNLHLKLYENGNLIQQTFTGDEGFYSFDTHSFDNYEVQLDTSNIPFSSICPSSNNYLDTISISDSLIYGNDFALKCKSGFDIGVWSIYSSGFRPARRSVVNVRAGDIANFYGVHCASGVSGTLNITINGSAHYYGPVAGALTPSNVTGNIITYNIADFGLINSNTDFAFEVETDTNTTSGSSICIDASFLPIVGDYNVSNDFLTNCFTVSASFDPNDKQVYPKGITDTSQNWLTYTIRFQNTGTAPADNIYILDSLNNNLDVSSFKLLASSHALYAQILEGGIARFNFSNINLPDSNDNEPLSHGYVQYKIKLKDNLTIGTQIQNTAYIYFDFNAPVVTNTTSNTIDIVNGIISKDNLSTLNIWPIPFENNFTIQTDLSSVGSRFSIVNLLGSEIYEGKINSTQLKINSESWITGIYFLRMDSKSGSILRKLIKK